LSVYDTVGLSAKASDEVTQLASSRDPLSPEDEATVSVVTKTRIDQIRRSRWIILAFEEREQNKGRMERAIALRRLKDRIENETAALLTQYIGSIDSAFLVRQTSEASRVLFLKIQRMPLQQLQAGSVSAYDVARSTLGTAHPLRTEIALNYSVFHFEIAVSKEASLVAMDFFWEVHFSFMRIEVYGRRLLKCSIHL
jgi:hypothetical protein